MPNKFYFQIDLSSCGYAIFDTNPIHMQTPPDDQNVIRFGFYSALLLAALTLIAFTFGMMAVPPAGPYCPGNCIDYPYLDSLDHYPHDYYWMYASVFQLVVYVIFMVSVYFSAPIERKINAFLGVSFALMTSVILLTDYFVQFAVVPASLMKGETEGIALLTQYNGNGLFIALEEIGYILMSISFVFIAPVFSRQNRLELALRWILTLPVILILMFFLYYSIRYGVHRSYRFEVAAIGVNWMVLIVVGIMSAVFYRRKLKNESADQSFREAAAG